MEAVTRILSRPVAKPYRSKSISPNDRIYLNENGHVDFAPDDIENPKNWSFVRKAYITVVAVLLVVNTTFASSAPSGVVKSISQDLNVSSEAAGLVITLFLLGYCAGPLFFAPLSEFFGRRWIFYLTFLGYIAFNFLCAFTPNFAGLLVGRFFTGTFASAALSNAPGVLADVWAPVARGNAMAIFSLMTFAGPALGPVIGGFLELTKNWRWIFYVLLWFGGITLPLMFTLPETLPSAVLQNKAARIRRAKIPGFENVISPVEATNRSLRGIFKIALTRPWVILFDTISFLVAIYLSVVYTLLYMLFTIYPIVFQQKRGWNSGVGELPLLGSMVGAAIGACIVILFSFRDQKKYKEHGYKGTPEDRLIVGMIGGVGFSVTMFWFAWTANYDSIHWIVPTIAGVFLSTSILLIFVSFLNYLTDSYLMYAASAMAANTVARSACGAASPLFTQQMFNALGVGGGGSLIGGVATLLAIIPFAFYKYGKQIRIKSKFAPTAPEPSEEEQPSDEEKAEGQGQFNSSDSSSTIGSSISSLNRTTSKASSVGPHSTRIHEVPQNAIGQPRTENTNFGKEANTVPHSSRVTDGLDGSRHIHSPSVESNHHTSIHRQTTVSPHYELVESRH